MAPPERTRLTIYTALVGSKEPLKDPLALLPRGAPTDLELDFVCVTDDRTLRSGTWRFEYLKTSHLPAEKLSRRPKALPHEYFPQAELSLYIDNTILLRRLPQASDLATARPYLLQAFRHPQRGRLQEEADVVAQLGYEEIGTICRQLDFYTSRGALEDLPALAAGGVLLRSHHHETVRSFGVLWWENLLAFSKRDQLSMGYALQQSGAEIEFLPAALNDSELVAWDDTPATHRVRANFDARRYAWLHRADEQARRDPGAHFLAHGHGTVQRYQRRLPLLEYICARHGSSLGSQVSPRRSIADGLESMLAPFRRGRCRYLLVRVHGGAAPRSYQDDEFAAAGLSISLFIGREGVCTLLDLSPADLLASDKVFVAQQEPFDLVVVLGPAGDQLAAAAQKLIRLQPPGRCALVAALTGPAPLHEVARAEKIIADASGAAVRTAVHGSRHDEVDGLLDNTLIGYASLPAATGGMVV